MEKKFLKEKASLLALLSIKGIGLFTIKKIYKKLKSFRKIFEDKNILKQNNLYLREEILEKIEKFEVEKYEEEILKLEEKNIKVIAFFEENYPKKLLEIEDFPPILYLKGKSKDIPDKCIAIVGTRHPSSYGIDVCERFTKELVEYGFCIVSGGARGIDYYAHKTTLDNKGETICVLGSGFNMMYPYEHRKLFERIGEEGWLITEFSPNTKPDAFNFPKRNRIISGLSLGVLVVEAPERSGALITAWWAGQQGREVFAIPGNITSKYSIGTNELIQNGAKLVMKVEDILEEFGIEKIEKPKKEIHLEKLEEKVYKNLSFNPIHIDDLMEKTQLNLAQLSTILLQLQIKGLIRELPGKQFVRKW